jgi:CRP/FNR family transcriptional regulator, cyclic AMP receptor protein
MGERVNGWGRWRDATHQGRVALLEGTLVFRGLPRRLLGRLATQVFEKRYAAGEHVFHQGEPGKALFVVQEGAVTVSRWTPGEGERVLRVLGPGACFGEMGLIDDFPRSATVRVTEPAHLLILYKTDFDALIEGHPRIALVTLRNLLRLIAGYVRVGGVAPQSSGDPADAGGARPEAGP